MDPMHFPLPSHMNLSGMYAHTFSSVGGLGVRKKTLRMFVYTIVENLGLCVQLTDDLQSFLDAFYWLQVFLCAAGAVGSAIAALVCLIGRKSRTSCSVQLGILAVYDVIFLLTCLLLSGLALEDAWDNVITKVLLVLRKLSLWGATYTVLDICCERCLSVCCPFMAHSRFTVRFALKRSAVILFAGILFVIPYIVDLTLGFSVGDGCVSARQLTPFGLTYTLYVSLLILYVLPFLVVIIVNVVFAITVCRLHRSTVRPNKDACSGKSSTAAEQQLSRLVLGLSGWYALSMLVPSLLFLVRLTRVELFLPDTDIRVAAVADLVVVLSCCFNFVFYFLLFRPFRQVLCVWLGRRAGSYRTFTSTLSTLTQSSEDSVQQQHVVVMPTAWPTVPSALREDFK